MCVRPHHHRRSDGTGFDKVLPPMLFKATAHDRDVSRPVKERHLTHGVTQDHVNGF